MDDVATLLNRYLSVAGAELTLALDRVSKSASAIQSAAADANAYGGSRTLLILAEDHAKGFEEFCKLAADAAQTALKPHIDLSDVHERAAAIAAVVATLDRARGEYIASLRTFVGEGPNGTAANDFFERTSARERSAREADLGLIFSPPAIHSPEFSRSGPRPSVVLFADVIHHTNNMTSNGGSTHVRACIDRQQDIVERYHGRLVKKLGHGMLAEFKSCIEAIRAANDIQIATKQESALPIQLRIGIAKGDVVADNGDIQGSTVDLASRLSVLAELGTISMAEAVRQELANKLSFPLKDLGFHTFKGSPNPVHVFQISPHADLSK
jgi:class 3 adenylate cyclase